jgi:hypothetical protein
MTPVTEVQGGPDTTLLGVRNIGPTTVSFGSPFPAPPLSYLRLPTTNSSRVSALPSSTRCSPQSPGPAMGRLLHGLATPSLARSYPRQTRSPSTGACTCR